jgi:hypothetical protein
MDVTLFWLHDREQDRCLVNIRKRMPGDLAYPAAVNGRSAGQLAPHDRCDSAPRATRVSTWELRLGSGR